MTARKAFWHASLVRWLIAIVLMVACTGAIVTNLVTRPARSDNVVRRILGGDAANLTPLLTQTRDGLALRLTAAQRGTLRGQMALSGTDGDLYALAAMDAVSAGRIDRARRLVGHGIAVDPRSQFGWLFRYDYAVRHGRGDDAVRSVVRLLAINHLGFPQYGPLLVELAANPRNRRSIAAALKTGPAWRGPFLDLLANRGIDPGLRFALMQNGDAGAVQPEQSRFVTDLVGKGDVERAYLAWVSILPAAALQRISAPYDPMFRGLPGSAPFNWQLGVDGGDRATIVPAGLDISFSGLKPVTLATQIMLVEPGTYRLTSILASASSASMADKSSALGWDVTCIPSGQRVGVLTFDLGAGAGAQASAPFVIPAAGCEAVALRLNGTASEFPVRLSAVVRSIRLDRAAAPAVEASPSVPVANAVAPVDQAEPVLP